MVLALMVLFILLWSIRGLQEETFKEQFLFDTTYMGGWSGSYRFLTSGFLHADYIHLLFNLATFYSFSEQLAFQIPVWIILLVFIVSIVGGNILAYALHKGHEYRALGASGGVSGVIFATLFLQPGGSINLLFIPIEIPSWLFALLFIGISIWGIRTQKDNIGHDAHLGGAVIGLLVTTLIYPYIVSQSPLLYSAVMGLSILFFIYLYRSHGILLTTGTKPFSNSFNKIKRVLKERETQKVVKEDEDIHTSVDLLLKKVSEQGIDSLSPHEMKQLQKGSKHFREQE